MEVDKGVWMMNARGKGSGKNGTRDEKKNILKREKRKGKENREKVEVRERAEGTGVMASWCVGVGWGLVAV